MEALTITVKQMAASLQIGRNRAYELVNEPDFPVVRLGRQLLIPIKGLEDWLAKRSQEK